MARTTIDIDDNLIALVMHRFNVRTKPEAVHLALSRLVPSPPTGELYNQVRGAGWEADLESLRRSREF